MASYFPKVYAHLHEAMQALANKQPELKQNFRGSIYPSITFNLGPKTECIDHNDCGNAPDVPCTVTSLGDFNADDGGDVYLWDLRLCIRFPAGSTILLSSAGMRHGNHPNRPRGNTVTPSRSTAWVGYSGGCILDSALQIRYLQGNASRLRGHMKKGGEPSWADYQSMFI
ncbi:hypothetical protein EVG20_g5049 [Dentipellis fragilis]|uniref:Uncharacterized protein n=1 Tax=Dentipellis fragilis TaxID=205917 RepID=A0A4Y9YWB1_9AGAM|nr:hypothetical protein EVG20_g5049 [Dentipellis fragilis]